MRRLAPIAAVLWLLLAACGNSALSPDQAPATGGKYTQTWTKDYSVTTCQKWAASMSEHQRWAASADMLVGGRTTWNITTMPTDSLIDVFEADITKSCEPEPTMTITDAATALLLIGGQSQYGD